LRSTSALAILVHGGFLLFLQPDLSIGRGLPPLQFQQLSGHLHVPGPDRGNAAQEAMHSSRLTNYLHPTLVHVYWIP
jgi:hypothetical protein